MQATTRSLLLSSLAITVLALIGTPMAGELAAQQSQARLASADLSTGDTPTFYADVLPILQQNCQICHQDAGRNMGGMVAPWPLVTYEDARVRAPRMASAVREGRRPPSQSSKHPCGHFRAASAVTGVQSRPRR